MQAVNKSVAKVMQAVVRRAILDLSSEDWLRSAEAEKRIKEGGFGIICQLAGYPDALLDTLHSIMSRSRAERKILTKELLGLLKEWNTTET